MEKSKNVFVLMEVIEDGVFTYERFVAIFSSRQKALDAGLDCAIKSKMTVGGRYEVEGDGLCYASAFCAYGDDWGACRSYYIKECEIR